MALLANGIPQRRIQNGRVDNGQILPVDSLRISYVKFAWSMASLTTNRVTAEDRRLILVKCSGDRLNMVRVAKEAGNLNRSVKVVIQFLVAW
jgi:hypothetical protein